MAISIISYLVSLNIERTHMVDNDSKQLVFDEVNNLGGAYTIMPYKPNKFHS